MNLVKIFIIGIIATVFGGFNAQATVIDVYAQANSSTGGVGAVTGINVGIGDQLIMITDVNDCWSAGAYPRDSNADGLTAGNPCPGNGVFGNHVQAGVSAAFGSLMGKIGAGDFFFVGTAFDQIMSEAGALALYYWDSNSYDNSGYVSVNIRLVSDQRILPEPGILGIFVLGFGLLLFRRRH
ncbi:MAG: PEP-CTERM sorting domain-containing protein [Emcibacter sp.]|nr:PEP-CTERM sorting domain-containing protein [Emcibacter sp.]